MSNLCLLPGARLIKDTEHRMEEGGSLFIFAKNTCTVLVLAVADISHPIFSSRGILGEEVRGVLLLILISIPVACRVDGQRPGPTEP